MEVAIFLYKLNYYKMRRWAGACVKIGGCLISQDIAMQSFRTLSAGFPPIVGIRRIANIFFVVPPLQLRKISMEKQVAVM
ncbi:hypothetical protein BKD03_05455 [Brucella sp. 09RB8471]|nr:hypothetical protein BKD03_05455 [Brucella sp. 09RB8471]